MSSNTNLTEKRRPVPWGSGHAVVVFLIFVFFAPLLAGGIVYQLRALLPTFEEERAVATNADDETSNRSGVANPPEGEGAEQKDVLSDADASAAPEEETESLSAFLQKKDADELRCSETQAFEEDSVFSPQNVATQHPLARLLIRSYFTPYFKLVVALFFLQVVFLAPIVEEFVFRVTLQGATEKALHVNNLSSCLDESTTPIRGVELDDAEKSALAPMRSREERARKWRVVLAILLPAFLFAVLHSGVHDNPENQQSLNELFATLVESNVSCLAALCLGVLFLMKKTDAARIDFGMEPRFTRASVARFLLNWGRGAFLLAIGAPIIFGVNFLCQTLFPDVVVAPIPILLLALYEGVVYYRSRQLATILGMHMTLNFISFTILMALILGF